MCSIIGSFDKEKFLELVKLNSYRGTFSHSLTCINPETLTSVTIKKFGPFKEFVLDIVPDGYYMLGHSQAPTGGLTEDPDRIHPYVNTPFKLLHNGIIKPQTMELINATLHTSYEWDTQALAEYITKGGHCKMYLPPGFVKALEDIEGSFACCLLQGNDHIYMFRNSVAPLFIDNNLNLSSTPFREAQSIMFNTIFQLNLHNKTYEEVTTFNNKESPFYFGGDDA